MLQVQKLEHRKIDTATFSNLDSLMHLFLTFLYNEEDYKFWTRI